MFIAFYSYARFCAFEGYVIFGKEGTYMFLEVQNTEGKPLKKYEKINELGITLNPQPMS